MINANTQIHCTSFDSVQCSVVVVECLCLNPCWCGGMFMLFVMCGISRMIFLSVFAMGESNTTGLYDVPSVVPLPCLRIGIILAIFHVWDCVCVE